MSRSSSAAARWSKRVIRVTALVATVGAAGCGGAANPYAPSGITHDTFPAPSVFGRVVVQGRPVQGVRVVVAPGASTGSHGYVTATSSEAGNFAAAAPWSNVLVLARDGNRMGFATGSSVSGSSQIGDVELKDISSLASSPLPPGTGLDDAIPLTALSRQGAIAPELGELASITWDSVEMRATFHFAEQLLARQIDLGDALDVVDHGQRFYDIDTSSIVLWHDGTAVIFNAEESTLITVFQTEIKSGWVPL